MKKNNDNCFLEINENIIRSQLLVENDVANEELQGLFPKPDTSARATTIRPSPGICIKVKTVNESKIFVNVCTSQYIPLPEDINDDELVALLESEEPGKFKVPMSIGEPHQEKDNSDETCNAYDVVVNPQFLEKTLNNPLFYNFFVVVTLEGIEHKYQMELDKNSYALLKNKKYHGTMPQQTVKTILPLVQELTGKRSTLPVGGASSPVVSKPLIREISSKSVETVVTKQTPKHYLKKVNIGNHWYLLAKVELPSDISCEQVSVDVGGDRLLVETSHYFLDIFVPCDLDEQFASASFITSSRVGF